MKNRKAKILLARRNGVGVWRWLKISNRRVRLTGCCGVMGHSCCKKPSAAQTAGETTVLSELNGSDICLHYSEKNYPRKSRTTEFLFLILFTVLMIPISPLLLVWFIGKIIEPVIELYNDVVWASFNTLHNKINPYKEN